MKQKKGLENFIPINRKFFDHPFWREERTFSKSEAWLDLIRSARFEGSTATALIGGRLVSWTRGQLPASLRFLAERWNWSNNKVDNFLKLLEKEKMVKRLSDGGQTVVCLINYEDYNNSGQQKGQQKGQQEPHPIDDSDEQEDTERDSKKNERGTGEGQARDKTKIVKKVNTEEEFLSGVPPIYTLEDQSKFKALTDWITKNAPLVAKMKEPLSISQYMKLKVKYSSNEIADMLTKMHNYKPLLQKNNSTYLTFLNWSGRYQNTTANEPNDATAERMEKLFSKKAKS